MTPLRALTILLLACGAPSVFAQVFRCADASGKVAYQAAPCADEGRQTQLKIAAPPPLPSGSAPRASAWKGYKPPAEAVITFTYDPRDEPVGYSTERMEAAIRQAMAAWMARCQVRLTYAGRAPAQLPGTPSRVPIRWAAEYVRSNVAGTGGPAHGIALSPLFREENMARVMTHEMGHVLGLPHNHEDPASIMSYLQHGDARRRGQLSESDAVACNLSMQARFGVPYQPPEGALPAESGPRMTDREALDRIRARQQQADREALRR